MFITNNKENFASDAKKYFESLYEKSNGLIYTKSKSYFHYHVSTNFDLYDTDVMYVDGDFRKSLFNLIQANPLTQLMEEFAYMFDIDKIDFILHEDKKAIVYRTESEAGAVMIGNDNWQILIPNGYGDGLTDVIITSIDKTIPMNFFTAVKGEFNIYMNDDFKNKEITYRLSGEYTVYTDNGTVLFNYLEE